MTSKCILGTLTVELEGRVDTSNAADIDKELFELIAVNKPHKVILDAAKLEYISSVGLRVVLKLKKAVNDTSVVNASLEIYDIFSMTGFTDIIDVRKALREISVEGCEVIGKGGHGTVYRLDGDTIVKVYNSGEPIEDIEREISFSKKAFVFGIPTAVSYDVVKSGEQYGVVFELINADTLANRLNAEPKNFDVYCQKYTELIRKLHSTEADTQMFSNTKAMYNAWAEDMTEFYTREQVDLLHRVINTIPDRTTFIHNDIHPKNIMVQDGELLLIDMSDITYGHPIFDYARIVLTHIYTGEQYCKHNIGIEYSMALDMFDRVVRDNFPGRDNEQFKGLLKLFGAMKFSVAPAVVKTQPAQLRQAVVNKALEIFFPYAEKLIGAVDF